GFLSGDYRRVAEVHFAAGYVPPRRSVDAFAQACRAIGEPILGQPLQEISFARLLAQLFQVTEQFEMETQPQLLLLQKTMVLVEALGRRLDPEVNMWTLARPLVEDWMRENRGPEARLRQGLESLTQTIERFPGMVPGLDPDIHVLCPACDKDVDGRIKSGHDARFVGRPKRQRQALPHASEPAHSADHLGRYRRL